MFSKKTKATATEPTTTIEALREQYELNSLRIQNEAEKNLMETENLKLKLGKMSKELYGTENYSEKRSFWPHIFWIFALLIVAGVEIPLNAMSFEIFDRTQTETRIMAVLFGILVATLSHFTGYGFKRSQVGDRSYSAMGWLCLLIAIIAFAITASFRVQYMSEMGMKSSLSWISQFGFALIIFSIGAIASYFHTSSVKNLKLEKVFKSELRRLKTLRRELQRILNKKNGLLKKYREDYTRIEQMGKENEEEEKQNIKETAIENAKQEEEKKSEFDDYESKFHEALKEAHVMAKSYGDKKSQLISDTSFMTLRARLNTLLQQLEKLAQSAINGTERYEKMNNEYNLLIA
ncbi:MAG: hypothetical protein QG594_177 [Bacteroidota bacterium]|nr:hypothetical protein [Bacteroidota bacterium]